VSTPAQPAIGDPVVVDGIKYRIRAIGQLAQLWDRIARKEAHVDPDHLVWDRVAGVWRVGPT